MDVTDEKELFAKSRWCVVGWQDPDIHEIERSSPMPRDETINVASQVIACRRWHIRFRDVKALSHSHWSRIGGGRLPADSLEEGSSREQPRDS